MKIRSMMLIWDGVVRAADEEKVPRLPSSHPHHSASSEGDINGFRCEIYGMVYFLPEGISLASFLARQSPIIHFHSGVFMGIVCFISSSISFYLWHFFYLQHNFLLFSSAFFFSLIAEFYFIFCIFFLFAVSVLFAGLICFCCNGGSRPSHLTIQVTITQNRIKV